MRRCRGTKISMPIIPVVMCGGTGTRLWPASRESRPKQFMPLFGHRSTFQDTILRVGNPELFDKPIVITHSDFRFVVADQLRAFGIAADIILEPIRRDSARRSRSRPHWRRNAPPTPSSWSLLPITPSPTRTLLQLPVGPPFRQPKPDGS